MNKPKTLSRILLNREKALKGLDKQIDALNKQIMKSNEEATKKWIALKSH